MKKSEHMNKHLKRSGFTLTEVMVAATISSAVIIGTVNLMALTSRHTSDGSRLLNYNEQARRLEQTLTRSIQQGKALSVYDDYIEVMRPGVSTTFTIIYEDADDNPDTLENNRLIYDPNGIYGDGDEIVLATHISPLEDEPMFEHIMQERGAVRVNLHIGDRASSDTQYSARGALRKSAGGVEVRLIATPRNTWDWRQSLKYK